MTKKLKLDMDVVKSIALWYQHGIEAGSFTMALLEGRYKDAEHAAHPLMKPHIEDHIQYVESLPEEGRGSNVSNFTGGIKLELVA
ncbi:hypothetical protein A3715_10260 [Oleiphilus sp. HI0009]|nr:hypothetical protein A3715_10260 [Oleiphilus sp. HI0009]